MAFAYFTGLELATWPAMAALIWPDEADGPDPAELARLTDDGCPHAADDAEERPAPEGGDHA
jgi:hypothetical protein